MGFCCSNHIDDCDKVRIRNFLSIFEKDCLTPYMSTFYKIFGAGLPTTCQYFHVYRDKKDSLEYKVSSYFMLNGLGIAQQLYDGCSITFLGYAFAHCTSLCYIVNIDNNTYIFRNDNNIFCLLAWGRSGGHKEYKKYHSNTQT